MNRRRLIRLGTVLLLCLSSCAPTPVADPLGVMADRSRDPAQRLAAIEQVGLIRDAPEPQAVAAAMHRVLWSDAQPTDLRLLAMDRLIEYDADAFWHTAEQKILHVDLWPVLGPLIEKAAQRGDPSFTPALVRSYTRASQVVPDTERPERDAILALNPGKTVERVVWDVCAGDASSLPLATRVDAWTLTVRLSGLDAAGKLLDETHTDAPLIRDLREARLLGMLPINREGVLRLMRVRAMADGRYWDNAKQLIQQLRGTRRDGLALRHLPVVCQMAAADPLPDKSAMLTQVRRRLSSVEPTVRTTAGVLRELPEESFSSHASGLCWADLVLIDRLLDAMADRTLVAELFRQADGDLADTTTEHGGVLDIVDGRFIAEPFLPVIRAHDQKFYSSDALIQRMYTGLFHYHFHAQKYMNGEYAGPGAGDLAFVENLQASAVVFTFLDRDTLGVDYYQPGESGGAGGVVIDLGVIRR